MQAIFKYFRKRALQQLEKRDGRPERQHRVRVRSSRRRTREFVFQGETVLPDCARPANGDAGRNRSKRVPLAGCCEPLQGLIR